MSPRRRTDQLKRVVAQIHHNIDRALEGVMTLDNTFPERYEQQREAIEQIGNALLLAQELCKVFWAITWGKVPDDLDAYR